MTNKAICYMKWLPMLVLFLCAGCASPWRAGMNGDIPMLESCISQGQDINQQNPGGDSALTLASFNGKTDIVRVLIAKGAKLDIQNQGGNTALILAAHSGSIDIARTLIEKDAELDIQNQVGNTALIIAADKGNVDIARILVEKGAKLNIQNKIHGTTALMQAIDKGNTDIARMFIEKGANLNTKDQVGNTALIMAAGKGNADVARMLIEKGANLDIQQKNSEDAKLIYGQTALIIAVDKGNTDIARMLIEKGAKLDIQNQVGNTALITAAGKGNADVAQLLLDREASLNIRNKGGKTALDFAVATNNHTIAEMFRARTSNPPPPKSGSPNLPGTYATYTGTGWVTEGGYIVTNYHVVEGQVQLKVRFNSLGTEEFPAKLVLSDQHNDLAIIQLEGTPKNKSKGIPISSKLPKAGADVFTIGYPKSDVMGVSPKVTNGIISSLSGIQDDPRIIQTTVAIQSGNSGGPLLTMNGEVVGVTTSTLRTKVSEKGIDVPQGVNYAVKSAYVTALLSSLPQEPAYPMTILTSNKLEDMIPKIQDSIVQIIVKSNK